MTEPDQFARALLEAAPDAVVVVDEGGQIALLNAQAERLFGYGRDQLQGRSFDSLVGSGCRAMQQRLRELTAATAEARQASGDALEVCVTRRDGIEVPVEITLAPVHWAGAGYSIAMVRDLSDRRRLEERLRYLSSHDALTGLVNRGAFDEALARLEREGPHPVAVVVVDLDDLKRVNDERGHAAGDALLRCTAEVLRRTFRAGDVVARLGGDEFAVLAAGRDAGAVEVLARRLEEAVTLHNCQRHATPLRLSVGVALAESGASLAVALQAADARMYSMKRLHHGREAH